MRPPVPTPLLAAAALALLPLRPAMAADAPALRPCAVLTAGTGRSDGDASVDKEAVDNDRTLATAVEHRLMDEGYVVRLVFVDPALQGRTPSLPDRAMRLYKCDTLVEIDHVVQTQGTGSFFGFDVQVRHPAAATDVTEIPPAWKKSWRLRLDKPTLDVYRHADMAHRMVDDLSAAHAIDGDRGGPVDAAEVRAEYDRLAANLRATKEYHVRHILVASEADANAALARVRDQHEDFAQVARDVSKDTGSAEKGGELDWTPASSYVQPFAAAIVSAPPQGLVDHVVHSQFGWHVVEVLGVREQPVPPFDQVEPRIAALVRWKHVVTP